MTADADPSRSSPPGSEPGAQPAAPQGVLSGATTLSSSMTGVEIGTQIMGTFEIAEHIATGGMGEVYRGINIHTREPVAIKIVLAALAHDEKILSLFQKEATVLGRLHHDAIVRYQLFTIDPVIRRACLIMEFVEGRALSDYIVDGPVPLEDVRRLMARLAGGLQKAHDLGVVHRDLSPDNVIVTDGDIGHAKLIDFGIAKSSNFGGGTLLDGQFAGKYNYVSPEQLGRFKGHITARSDIYALALVIAAACRGRVVDMGDSPADAVEARMGVPDLEGVYPELRPLLEMMLQPNPDDRPQDMDAVVNYLQNPELLGPVPAAASPADAARRGPSDTLVPPPPMSQPPAFRFTDASGSQTPIPPGAGVSRPPDGTVVSVAPFQSTPPAPERPAASVSASAATQLSEPPLPAEPPQSVASPSAPEGNESPFGAPPPTPATGAASSPADLKQALAPKPAEKRSLALPVMGLLGILAIGGAGAWFGGLLGGSGDEVASLPAESTGAVAQPPTTPTPEAQSRPVSQSPSETPAPAATTPPAVAESPPQVAATPPSKPPGPSNGDVASAVAPPNVSDSPVGSREPPSSPAAERLAEQMVAMAGPTVRAPQGESGAAAVPPSPPAVTAAATPAPTVAAPPPVPEEAAHDVSTPEGWLAAYDLPQCAFVRPGRPLNNGFAVEAFGTDVAPFIALDQSFAAAQGYEADIGLRIVTEAQCGVLDFLQQNRGAAGVAQPVVTLEGDVLRTGEEAPLRGVVGNLSGRMAYLLLVDDRGGAYDISALLKKVSPDERSFLLAVRAANRSDAPPLRPHMLVAFALDRQVSGIAFSQGDSAESVLAQVRSQIVARGEPVAVSVGYFRLEDG